MRQSAILLIGMLGAACAGAPPVAQKAPNIYEGAPDWVKKGGAAFSGDHGKAFYGVGRISDIMNPASRSDLAEAKARAAVGDIMNQYVSKLTKIYNEATSQSTAAGVSPQEDQRAEQALKTFTSAQLNGVEIVDRWISQDNSTEFALAKLDFDGFRDSVQKAHELSDRMRDVIKAHSDAAFVELNAEEAKHRTQ